ncbi:MAG: hypothetical protein HFE44_05000 [Oscillospiraceae bacterium]|jgi:flagellar hook-length control protein FliK|nr:hypothetical protein [Oscillospiraceae bacterium]
MDVANVSVQMVQPVQQQETTVQAQSQGQEQGGAQNFVTLLLQMLGGDTPGKEDILAALKANKDAEEEGMNLMLQMMMEMMATNPELALNIHTVSPETLSELGWGTVPALEQFFAQQGLNAPVIEGVEVMDDLVNPDGEAENGGQNINANPIFEALEEMVGENSEEVIPVTVEHNFRQNHNFFDQGANDFRNAVSQAKQEMDFMSSTQNLGKDQKRVEVDVEKLQSEVDSGKFYTVNTPPEADELPEEPVTPAEVAQQVKEGIIQELGSGKDEFVVKLKPEGLGEITVRLMQDGDRIAMSISASNSHVARLLGSELEQLREALRPYNTVVQEVVDQQAYASNQDFGQSFSSSQYQQRQYDGQQRRSGSSFQAFINGEEPVTVEEIPAGTRRIISTGLNTYYV